jgi:hypothetical protein
MLRPGKARANEMSEFVLCPAEIIFQRDVTTKEMTFLILLLDSTMDILFICRSLYWTGAAPYILSQNESLRAFVHFRSCPISGKTFLPLTHFCRA